MNRIDTAFQRLKADRQKGFIAYICAGDPDLAATGQLADQFQQIGVDVLELGVPFSDPLADGVVNQLAAERALKSRTTLKRVLALIRQLRRKRNEIPIVLYIYFNQIHRHGVTAFARDAAAAGVDGVLALDLPPEEAATYEAALNHGGVHPIYLVAPTTPPDRVADICRHARGFVYYVSREGVTGMQHAVSQTIRPMMKTIRQTTALPIAVGFGITTPAQAAEVAADADAVVVGSAIVNQIARYSKKSNMATHVARFVAPLVRAVK